MDRLELLNKIRNKKIILFGAGKKAKEFYNNYGKELKIVFCVSNNLSEKKFYIEETAVCDVKPVRGMVINSDEFVIICAADSASMQNQLSDMGYDMGKQYLDSELYRILVEDKKIAVFYGVCYMRAIKDCLNYSNSFLSNYNSFYFLDYVKYDFTGQSLLYLLIESCDLFVYTSYFSPAALRKIDGFLLRLKAGCIKISVPVITFTGIYPRIEGKVNDINPYCVISAKAPYSPFSVGDININKLIDAHKTTGEIVSLVSDPNFYSKKFLNDNLTKELHRLSMAEKFSNIKIIDFIEKNYKKMRLFINESHVSNVIIIEISNRLLGQLALVQDIDAETPALKTPLLNTSEVPVYPSVIYHLRLEQYKGEATYKLFTYQGCKEVTFEEYIVLYVEYCKKIKSYIEKGFFPA